MKLFREQILGRFGVPKSIITDNGNQHTSKTFRQYLENTGVERRLAAIYLPHENPYVCTNCTV